jgi:hypothetical protein
VVVDEWCGCVCVCDAVCCFFLIPRSTSLTIITYYIDINTQAQLLSQTMQLAISSLSCSFLFLFFSSQAAAQSLYGTVPFADEKITGPQV